MDIGQVGFHNEKLLKFTNVTKENSIARKFKKIQIEKEITHMKILHEDYIKEENKIQKAMKEKERLRELNEKKEAHKKKEMMEYKDIFKKEEMKSNKEIDDDDDFM